MQEKNKNNIFIVGDETYLKKVMRNKILDKYNVDINDLNVFRVAGKNYDINEIGIAINSYPMFAEYKIVILEDTDILNKYSDQVRDILDKKPNSTILIVDEEKVDKRSKSYKIVKDYMYMIELNQGNEDNQISLINSILKSNNRAMDYRSKKYIIENSEEDLYSIKNNMDKLINYTYDHRITYEMVLKNIPIKLQNKVFLLIDSIIKNDPQMAIDKYKDLILLKESHYKIMTLIYRQFRILMLVKDCNCDDKTMAKNIGSAEFVVKNSKKLAEKIDKKVILEIMDMCVELEKNIKSGYIEEKLGVEELILTALVKIRDNKNNHRK